MVHNFGQIHASSHPNNHSFILRFIHEDLHNSFAVFRIDASDILFVVNTGKARIVDTFAEDFEAMGEVGHLTVEVQNTGEIGAQFSISVAQCSGHHNLPAKTVTINPAQTVNVTFKLQSFHAKGQYVVCEGKGSYTAALTIGHHTRSDLQCSCLTLVTASFKLPRWTSMLRALASATEPVAVL